jgi:hypothetical protein
MGLATAILAACLLALIPAQGGTLSGASKKEKKKKTKLVYVCACLRTMSCSCMTEAKTEGPCSCGTRGGPPMVAVPADSSWAKHNRDELAK